MCNKGIECLKKTNNFVDNQQQPHQAHYLMDTPTSATNLAPDSNHGSNDEIPRVKFLCSFLGSIMPRPQDGKLRYVGGETRIVSVPRDISYEELMSKMRELYEGATIFKYQQPDEDLDALVSVVNDDDVTNMMEEYEKLGSGDGFTRLRIFLFSHPDQDGSAHYGDGDDRESERRYVDALNNLNDGADFRRQQSESPLMTPVDDFHVQEYFLNQLSVDGGLHGQRGSETPQYNLHHVAIPQRYNEMESAWSPSYYSPRHPGHHDPRPLSEFPSSPSSARYHMQFGELPDKIMDRVPPDHQPPYSENAMWIPSGPISGDKAGFPGNLFQGPRGVEGNSVCDHCRGAFQRNQLHLEQPNIGNGLPQVANQCADCPPNRETFMLNVDAKLHQSMYLKDQNDPRSIYSENHSQDRGRILQHQLSVHADDARTHISGVGRFNDHYVVDGPGINYPIVPANLADGHHIPPNYINHRAGPELSNEVFHDQAVATAHQVLIPSPEEHAVRYGNFQYAYGTDSIYSMPHGHLHGQTPWRNAQNSMHGASPYEACGVTPQVNGSVNPAFLRGTVEGSHRIGSGMDSQHPWVEPSPKVLGFDGPMAPKYSYGHAAKLNPNAFGPENKHSYNLETITPLHPVEKLNLSSASPAGYNQEPININVTEKATKEHKNIHDVEKEADYVGKVESLGVPNIPCPEENMITQTNNVAAVVEPVNSNCLRHAEESSDVVNADDRDPAAEPGDSKLSMNFNHIPELIASVKKAALEEAENKLKATVEENVSPAKDNSLPNDAAILETEAVIANEEQELDSDNDTNKIEPTKAEAEAIERGLQTIKNEDLEEIRELGSGTYGAVYHGKWKGSDVAIKRIKASCFAGKPSERERLIADFWKEALILSSLHHPNVVSFYGIVRDGPDGSLATVTEFMINGSLKQFLQKKDRTIDRRKRLIIAMDAAFGMEYLHGKNIVHFDLKCENLLVNMRDPQRPVCKIGDLGLSKVKQHTLVSGGVRGTLPWMAPELLSGKSHMVTEKIDVYSFGIVMWELLTGEEPYTDMHCASIIGGIVNNTLRPKIPTWCDPEWKALMESCWSSDPADRPSFSEISQKLRNMAAAMNVK